MAKNSNQKSKKKKVKLNMQQLKSNPKALIIFFIILCIAIYCLYLVVKLVKNPTNTFLVEQGKIYQEETTTGYIIREETVVKGQNYKNGMLQIKAEGERVAKEEAIFRYYTNGEENLIKKIEELDSKIDEALGNEKTLFSSDIKALEKQIDDKIVTIFEENNLQNITETKKQITDSITKKAKIAGDLSPAGSYLKKLIDERSKYETQLNAGAEYLKAPISGVVSYKVDGYEDVLKSTDFSVLTKDFLQGLNLKTGQVVADSKESGKIIDNYKCYVACILNSTYAKQAKIGDKVKIRLTNGTEVTSTVEYMSEEENDIIIVFKLSKSVQELISYRKISFDVIWWSDSGKKVPNDAIGYEQKGDKQVAYVIRTRMGYQDKIWIKILRQNDKYAIVDNYVSEELQELGYNSEEIKAKKSLTLYDEVLKSPQN